MVDAGKYFVINRGRQYGKTTTLNALENYLSQEYILVSIDFQFLDASDFESTETFVTAFAQELNELANEKHQISEELAKQLHKIAVGTNGYTRMANLFKWLGTWCKNASKPIVLIIDEVDSASNNQVFLDFLAQLRGYYLNRNRKPTFQFAILTGVHDIRNLRQKIRSDAEHKHNIPWNIASPFDIDMSFSPYDIAGMLTDYENGRHTG